MSRALACALAATLVSACAHLDPADRAPRTDPVARLAPAGPSPWAVDFADPTLAGLLRAADAGALDVKIALARLTRAKADVDTAHAARSLHVQVGAEAAAGGTSFRDARSAATPTFEATYDVDLWGRLKQAQAAVGHDQAAAEADVVAARLLVAADTTRAYAALRGAQADGLAADQRVQLAERELALTERRVAEGVAGHDAIGAARLALARAVATREAAHEDEALQTARLADLTGQPGLQIPAGSIPAAGPAKPVGSSDVVTARPDVQAALSRLRAADARRAEAVAASRPQFQIAAVLGAPDAAIATLLDARALAWALAASLSDDLLDGGAARAKVHAASSEADVADLEYRKAVLTGWAEVRSALTDQARAARELSAAQAALEQSRSAVALTEVRHGEGVADGFDRVTALSAQAGSEDQLRAARLGLVEARVRLALATGGR